MSSPSPERDLVIMNLPIYIQRPPDILEPLIARHLLIHVHMILSADDSIRVEFSWQHVKTSSPHGPPTPMFTVDAHCPIDTDLFVPNDPFARPIFVFSTHRTPAGLPFHTSVAIFLFDWHGNILLDAEIAQLVYRPFRRTDALRLILPANEFAVMGMESVGDESFTRAGSEDTYQAFTRASSEDTYQALTRASSEAM